MFAHYIVCKVSHDFSRLERVLYCWLHKGVVAALLSLCFEAKRWEYIITTGQYMNCQTFSTLQNGPLLEISFHSIQVDLRACFLYCLCRFVLLWPFSKIFGCLVYAQRQLSTREHQNAYAPLEFVQFSCSFCPCYLSQNYEGGLARGQAAWTALLAFQSSGRPTSVICVLLVFGVLRNRENSERMNFVVSHVHVFLDVDRFCWLLVFLTTLPLTAKKMFG